MNSSFSTINEIPTVHSLQSDPSDLTNIKTLTWQGKTVYALYMPKEAITPNMHPELSGQNNNDYSIKLEVLDNTFGDVKTDLPTVYINRIPTVGCSGAMRLSKLYSFDPSTLTLKHKIDDFSYIMEDNEHINILGLKSTFTKKVI